MSSKCCPSCGSENPLESNYCISCGVDLQGSQAGIRPQYQLPQLPPNSRPGIASFVMGLTSLGLPFILAGVSGYWFQQAAGQTDGTAIKSPLCLVIALAVVLAVTVAALIVGLIGRSQKHRNRFHGTWGVRIAGGVIGALLLLLVIVTLFSLSWDGNR